MTRRSNETFVGWVLALLTKAREALRADAERHAITDAEFMLGKPVASQADEDLAVLGIEIARHGNMASLVASGPGRDRWLASAASLQRIHDFILQARSAKL